MRVFILPVSTLITPLNAPARDAWLLDGTLGQRMERELVSAGLSIERSSSLADAEQQARKEPRGAFILADSVACSRIVLRRFIRAALKTNGDRALVCALPRAQATDLMSYLDGLAPIGGSAPNHTAWTAPLYFVRGEASCSQAQPLMLPYREKVLRFPLPPGMIGKHEDSFAFGNSYLCTVGNWVHVLRINIANLFSWWYDRLRGGMWIGGGSWFAWRALVGFPWIGGRLGEAINAVSARARCHHSATIEFSVIQTGAKIGPKAIIRGSYIGARAQIGNGARVINSVIGSGAFVSMNSSVVASVVYPGAMAGQMLMQGSVLGTNSCAFTNSNFFDLNFTKNIRVLHHGSYADTGSQYLGVCVGPNARISAGVWVASGREIPPGALLVKPSFEIAGRIDRDLRPGEPAIVHDGTVVPLHEPQP